MDDNGKWCTEEEEIKSTVESFYASLFTSNSPSNAACKSVLEAMQPLISSVDNAALLRPFTKEGVFEAISQTHPCKAPEPDGMHAIFYKKIQHSPCLKVSKEH